MPGFAPTGGQFSRPSLASDSGQKERSVAGRHGTRCLLSLSSLICLETCSPSRRAQPPARSLADLGVLLLYLPRTGALLHHGPYYYSCIHVTANNTTNRGHLLNVYHGPSAVTGDLYILGVVCRRWGRLTQKERREFQAEGTEWAEPRQGECHSVTGE